MSEWGRRDLSVDNVKLRSAVAVAHQVDSAVRTPTLYMCIRCPIPLLNLAVLMRTPLLTSNYAVSTSLHASFTGDPCEM